MLRPKWKRALRWVRRLPWILYLSIVILGGSFALAVSIFYLNALAIGGLTLASAVNISSVLLPVEGVLLGLAVLLDQSIRKAVIIYFGIISLLVSLTVVVTGQFLLQLGQQITFTIFTLETPIGTLALTLRTYFFLSLAIFVVTLTAYMGQAIKVLWEIEESYEHEFY